MMSALCCRCCCCREILRQIKDKPTHNPTKYPFFFHRRNPSLAVRYLVGMTQGDSIHAVDQTLEELMCWVDLANRVALSTEVTVLRTSIEPQARSDILLEMAEERSALIKRFSLGILAASAAIAAESVPLRNQQQALREEIAQLPARIEALEKGYLADMQARIDIRGAEMSNLDESRVRLSAEIRELSQRRDEELASIAAFRSDLDERRTRLQEFKVSSAREMQEMEAQLETLRHRVAAEKVVLEQLEEEEAVKRKKIELLSEMGIKATAAPRVEPHTTGASHGNPIVQTSSSSNRLDAGIQALQSVREHLRELRSGGASQSPQRSGSINGTSQLSAGTPAGAVQQGTAANSSSATTSSFLGASPIIPTSPRNGGQAASASLSSSTLYASPNVNPWKERLRQLQGDLQSLRADLGAK